MSVLDLYEGASQLPHVYCKKIILENGVNSTLVTLNLELLANTNTINSGWAKQDNVKFENRSVNFFNSLFVQVVPVVGSAVKLLKASNDPINIENDGPTNIYVAKRQLSDNTWIPYGKADKALVANSGKTWPALQQGVLAAYSRESSNKLTADPINLGEGSIFSDHSGEGFSKSLARGKIRKTIKDGKQYYEIPLTFKFSYTKDMGDLGFMFFTMLHTPHFVKSLLRIENNQELQKYYQSNKFGPMNSEIVFQDGALADTREQFIRNDGLSWDGSVHLHASNLTGKGGPDQNGYSGDGGFGANGGWMAGEEHIPSANQPKLRLTLVQNDKIDDFRISSNPPTPANVIGTFSSVPSGEVLPNAQVNSIVGPFQKITRKDFLRKNDDQYSTLYHTRDVRNIFRASFFINFRNFIRNNSNLYRSIFQNTNKNINNAGNEALDEILSKSKILEMKVYRERIDRNFENEEAKKLVGVLSEDEGIGDVIQSSTFSEVVLQKSFNGKRMFVFSDIETQFISSGTYKYSIEIKFKDGSYQLIFDLINSLKTTLSVITEYYNLATSSKPANVGSYTGKSVQRRSLYKKLKFKPYFDKLYNSFSDDFAKDLFAQGDNIPPLAEKFKLPKDELYVWQRASVQLFQLQAILGVFNIKNFPDLKVLNSMMDPVEGSPNGINYVIKIYNDVIDNLGMLLGNKKTKGSGGELTTNNAQSYNDYSLQDFKAPTSAIIEDKYDFDHPRSLYRASAINNLFIDYLQIGMSTLGSAYSGLISLSAEYYKNRCILDSAKFSTVSTTKASFNTTNIGRKQPIAEAGSDITKFQIVRDDYLKNSGYSFLTPSTVYFSEASLSQRQYFTCFSPTADNVLNTGVGTIFDTTFSSCDYESLLTVLMKYTNQKIQNKTTDIITNDDPYNQRLSHIKSLLNNLNVTFHSESTHDSFFNKRPGAVNGKKDGAATPFNLLYTEPNGLAVQSYSDGLINPSSYFNTATSILSSQEQFEVKYPRFRILSLANGTSLNNNEDLFNLPNNIKLFLYQNNRRQIGEGEAASPRFKVALEGSENAFLFFNFNMTVAVEVYNDRNEIAKDDTGSWRLLREDDLNDLTDRKLFCRLRPYYEKHMADIDIPILNEYFFIGSSVGSFVKPSGVSQAPNDLMQTIQYMQQKLLLKINEEVKPIKQNLALNPASSKATPSAATPVVATGAAPVAPSVSPAAPSVSATPSTQYSPGTTQGPSGGGSTSSY